MVVYMEREKYPRLSENRSRSGYSGFISASLQRHRLIVSKQKKLVETCCWISCWRGQIGQNLSSEVSLTLSLFISHMIMLSAEGCLVLSLVPDLLATSSRASPWISPTSPRGTFMFLAHFKGCLCLYEGNVPFHVLF